MEVGEDCKVFVGGIPRGTEDGVLKEHFGKYGTVTECVIVKDRFSGFDRGFAFVTFSESTASQRALQDSHEILGRKVDVKKAIERNAQLRERRHDNGINGNNKSENSSNDQIRTKKIFVGGLSANLTEEEFRSYFEKFGRINDVVVMHDNVTHRPRGFGFVTFDSEESVEEAVHENFQELNGRFVEVKKAVPKDGNTKNSRGSNGTINGGGLSCDNWYSQGFYPPNDYRFHYLPFGYDNTAWYGVYPPSRTDFGFPPTMPGSPWGHAPFSYVAVMSPYDSGAPIYPRVFNGWAGAPSFAANEYNGSLHSQVDEKSAESEIRDAGGVDSSEVPELEEGSYSSSGVQAAANGQLHDNIDQSHLVLSS